MDGFVSRSLNSNVFPPLTQGISSSVCNGIPIRGTCTWWLAAVLFCCCTSRVTSPKIWLSPSLILFPVVATSGDFCCCCCCCCWTCSCWSFSFLLFWNREEWLRLQTGLSAFRSFDFILFCTFLNNLPTEYEISCKWQSFFWSEFIQYLSNSGRHIRNN